MKKLVTSAVLSLMLLPLMAQQQEGMPSSPEEMEKKLVEYIEKEVEKYSSTLGLEYWQEFYADSTLNHNLHAMQDELNELKKAGVQNTDMYIAVHDKWDGKTYDAFMGFLTPEQREKYLKGGALRAKQARDKRAGIDVKKEKPSKKKKK